MKFIMIAGLPGSGKSFWAKKMAKKYKATIIDDPSDYEEIACSIVNSNRTTFIISDPFLCFESNRNSVESKLKQDFPDCHFEWFFFEKDIEACIRNYSMNFGKEISAEVLCFVEGYQIPLSTPKDNILKCYEQK